MLGALVGDAHDDEPGLALVEFLAQFLQVVATHSHRGVPGDRAEHGTACRGAQEQPAADRGEREQRDDESGRQADAAAHHATDTGRRLVLLGDLDLAVVAAADDGGVVGVHQTGLDVEVLDQLVVRLGVRVVVVHADDCNERVDGHGWCSLIGCGESVPNVTR